MSTYETSPELLISNLSLPLPVQLGSGIEGVQHFIDEINGGADSGGDKSAGVSGLELTPTKRGRFMFSLNSRLIGLRRDESLESEETPLATDMASLGSLPQIYYGTKDWAEADNRLRGLLRSYHASPRDKHAPKFDALGRIMFPHYEEAFVTIAGLQKITGPRPGIVYANYDDKVVSHVGKDYGLAVKRLQPAAFTWDQLSLDEYFSSSEDVRRVLNARGIDELTIDIAHIQTFKNSLQMVTQLGRLIGSVHVALGRSDLAKKDSEFAGSTMTAKRAFITSEAAARKTLEGEVLAEIASMWQQSAAPMPRNVVIETMPDTSRKRSAKELAAITQSVRAILARPIQSL